MQPKDNFKRFKKKENYEGKSYGQATDTWAGIHI